MSLDAAQSQKHMPQAASGVMNQVMGRRWMVAAGHPLAAQAAARILEAGGNAIDAGAAAGMMLGVVHPDMVSFAGVGPILVHVARSRKTYEVTGVGPYPRLASAEYYRTRCGGEIPTFSFDASHALKHAGLDSFIFYRLRQRERVVVILARAIEITIDHRVKAEIVLLDAADVHLGQLARGHPARAEIGQ